MSTLIAVPSTCWRTTACPRRRFCCRTVRGGGSGAPNCPRASPGAADEPFVREHRPRQRLHRLQPDPGRRRAATLGVAVSRTRSSSNPRRPTPPSAPSRKYGRSARSTGSARARGAAGDSDPRRRNRSVVRVEELVVGDLVQVGPGDQIVADGHARAGGNALPPRRIDPHRRGPSRSRAGPGDAVRSGSFAVEGVGAYIATDAISDARQPTPRHIAVHG